MSRIIDLLAMTIAAGMLGCTVLYVVLAWKGMTP